MAGDFEGDARPAGFAATLSRVASTTLKLIGTRFDQAIVELEIELHNAVAGLLWGVVLIAAALLALGFVGLLVVLAFKDSHPLLAALGVACAFGVIALCAGWQLRKAMRSQGSGIAAVRAEIAADLTAIDRQRVDRDA